MLVYIQMLPSKLEVVLPHSTTEATVKLWKVRLKYMNYSTSYCIDMIKCNWKDFEKLYTVVSSDPPNPDAIHQQVCTAEM